MSNAKSEIVSSYADCCFILVAMLRKLDPNDSYPLKLKTAVSTYPNKVIDETGKILLELHSFIDTWNESALIEYANEALNNGTVDQFVNRSAISTGEDREVQMIIGRVMGHYTKLGSEQKCGIKHTVQDMLGLYCMWKQH